MLFWTDDVSVIRVSRWGITRGTLSSQHVLTYIWMIITDNSFKIVSNYTVVTEIATVCRERKRRPLQTQFDPIPIHAATPTMSPLHVSDRSLPACVPSMRSTAAARANPFLMDALINKSKSFGSYVPVLQQKQKKKKGSRWPARPGLQSLSPCSFHTRLKTPGLRYKERSSVQNNAHDKHRPGKLEYFVKDAITRWSKHISEKDVASEFSMR